MATRDIVKVAEKAKGRIPDYYDMVAGDLFVLKRMVDEKGMDGTFDAVMMAFRYGFVLGHRATIAGKVKKKL